MLRYAIMFSEMASHSFIVCCTTRFESPYIISRVPPQALAIRMPCSNASYSASLLEALGKFIWSTYRSLSPFGDVSTTPTSAPSFLFEPSKYIVQELDRSGGVGVWSSTHSAQKSATTCDLSALRFW